MGFIKEVKEPYNQESDVIALIHYICNKSKCPHSCANVNWLLPRCNLFSNWDYIADLFLSVQYCRNFNRRLYHIVYSFDNLLDRTNLQMAFNLGNRMLSAYKPYQSFFVVHETSKHMHLHIVYNNISIFKQANLSEVLNIKYLHSLAEDYIYSCICRP